MADSGARPGYNIMDPPTLPAQGYEMAGSMWRLLRLLLIMPSAVILLLGLRAPPISTRLLDLLS